MLPRPVFPVAVDPCNDDGNVLLRFPVLSLFSRPLDDMSSNNDT
jgi:hypothetical protein